MSWRTNSSVSFRRIDDNIEPVCVSKIEKGTVVFYEVPVKSEGHITVDIIGYTMQCVYTGEIMFPCSFNTDISEKTPKNVKLKVFFDQVFDKTFRRKVTDRLATSLMDKCRGPFLFKALGAFSDSLEFNCLRVSYLNGETYLVAIRDIDEREVLKASRFEVKVPRLEDGYEKQMEAMMQVQIEYAGWYNMALPTREAALKLKPNVQVRVVSCEMDKDLEEKIMQYGVERDLGLTDIRERIAEIKAGGPEMSDDGMKRMMEDKYEELMEENFRTETQ